MQQFNENSYEVYVNMLAPISDHGWVGYFVQAPISVHGWIRTQCDKKAVLPCSVSFVPGRCM
jgi:hypothetical protein